jgi:DNA-binding transcriptional LysR family regulator
MNMTLRQLRAFVAVADRGSFTGASRQLHLTQSALSVLVRQLERELGVRLFDRSTRHVSLAEPGRDFYPFALRVLNELDHAVTSVGNLRDKKKGLLRLAAPQLMACTLIPPVIAGFTAAFPDVDVKLYDTPPDQMLGAVTAGQVEVAVGPDGDAEQALEKRPLLRDRHWLICRADHPLTRKRKVRWADLAGSPFIAPTRDFMSRLQLQLDQPARGLRIVPAHEVGYMTTAMGMVAAGLGVTACPSYSAPLAKAYGLAMRLLVEPQFYREVCIYSVAKKSLSPAAEAFVEFIQGYVKKQAAAAGA